jgi:hypothetical protein
MARATEAGRQVDKLHSAIYLSGLLLAGLLAGCSGGGATVDAAAGTLTLGQCTYLISEATVITGSDDMPITLAQIVPGQQMQISYRRGQHGAYIATAVSVLGN